MVRQDRLEVSRPKGWREEVIDYWDCDAWVRHLADRDPAFQREDQEGRQIHDRVLTADHSYLPDH